MSDYTKWLEAQTMHTSQAAFDVDFGHINYAELVPVVTEGSEFAASVAFVSSDAVGQAGFINGDADDVPVADIDASAVIKPVHFGGIGYTYGYDEVNRARAAGIDLSPRKATAARLAYEEFMQEFAFVGSVEKGIKGLINQDNANVTRSFDNSTWASATAAEILALVNKALALTGTEGRPTADTVLLPYTLYTRMASLLVDNSSTALDFITRYNIVAAHGGKVEIRSAIGLETAGTSSKKRIVAYRRSPDTVELQLPMPHRFLGVHQAGPLRWQVPGVFRVAGVNVAKKRDFAYLDNHSA